MAVATRADQELLSLGSADLYGENFVRALWHSERTFYNTLGVAKWHMSRRVRDSGYKVVVTGEGSDELFAGYPAFQRDMALHGGGRERSGEFVRRVAEGSILSESPVEHPAFQELCGFTPSWIQPWILTLERVRPLLAAPLRAELEDYDPVQAIAAAIDPDAVRGRHPLDQAQYTWIKTMLEGQILHWGGDRVDMAHSMESRPAFLDHHLAEFAAHIPPDVRIREGVEKWVLREAMRGVLPEVLYRRPKFAFMAPPQHVDEQKQAAAKRLIERWLAPESVESAGLFDPGRVAAFLDSLEEPREPPEAIRSDIVVNHLLGVQMLHGLFVEGAERPLAVVS
jgi:asparagine synthase (glutamine-hydrolysing)